ncbi:MAG: hypothetical protein ACL7BU_06535 [Candidatus Phlomobacter fragariae]
MLSPLNNLSENYSIPKFNLCSKEKNVNESNSTTSCSLFKKIKKIYNSSDNFVRKSSNKSNFIRQKVIDNKEIRTFIDNHLLQLNILDNVKLDKEGKFQLIDSTLAFAYSRQRDMFCKEEKNVEIRESYLIEIGKLSKDFGLRGKENSKGQFIPCASGAYPYATAVMSAVQKKYPLRTFNYNQRKTLENYAMQKVYKDIDKLCIEEGRIKSSDFYFKLDDIRQKYSLRANKMSSNIKVA